MLAVARQRGVMSARVPGMRAVTSVSHNCALPIFASPGFRKTSIVATVGHRGRDRRHIEALVAAGMNVMRLNMSHGEPKDQLPAIENLRAHLEEYNHGRPDHERREVAIALDTKGPEIRLGGLAGSAESVTVSEGQELLLSVDPLVAEAGTSHRLFVDLPSLPGAVLPGHRIIIGDGDLELEVLGLAGDREVRCRARNGSMVSARKGVHLLESKAHLPRVSERDKLDLRFAVNTGIDAVFASFVRDADDVRAVRAELARHCDGKEWPVPLVFAKVETEEAVRNFDSIAREADGVMIARGDLGIELPLELVFAVQKACVSKCNVLGKPVICATQMLDSMENNPRPTRAECSDVANAVIDGVDAVMLSAETAKGRYPGEAIRIMGRICQRAEAMIDYRQLYTQIRDAEASFPLPRRDPGHLVEDRLDRRAWADSAVASSFDHGSPMIVALAKTGLTAFQISKYRPRAHVVMACPDSRMCRRALFYRGILPLHVPELGKTPKERIKDDEVVQRCVSLGQAAGLCRTGQTVVAVHKAYRPDGSYVSLLKFLPVD